MVLNNNAHQILLEGYHSPLFESLKFYKNKLKSMFNLNSSFKIFLLWSLKLKHPIIFILLIYFITTTIITLLSSLRELFKLDTARLLSRFCLSHSLVLGLGCLQFLVSSLKVSKTPHTTVK